MNTNDFSKCKVGDKLWCIQLGECTVDEMSDHLVRVYSNGAFITFFLNGFASAHDVHQSLFFAEPHIIAPPEPVRLPDYKDGEWIAVWDDDSSLPILSRFLKFIRGGVRTYSNTSWQHSCRLAELSDVMAKWGEK